LIHCKGYRNFQFNERKIKKRGFATRPFFHTIKGFTLIELLVVISIIGVLSSIILASLQSARLAARDAALLSDVHQFEIAMTSYNLDHNDYPVAGGGQGYTDIFTALNQLKTKNYTSGDFSTEFSGNGNVYIHRCGLGLETCADQPAINLNTFWLNLCGNTTAKAAVLVHFNKLPAMWPAYNELYSVICFY
jgi:prepilin-type N-terminal cleavage/methylation domain-containing protein